MEIFVNGETGKITANTATATAWSISGDIVFLFVRGKMRGTWNAPEQREG